MPGDNFRPQLSPHAESYLAASGVGLVEGIGASMLVFPGDSLLTWTTAGGELLATNAIESCATKLAPVRTLELELGCALGQREPPSSVSLEARVAELERRLDELERG